jgi:hypothetical protein
MWRRCSRPGRTPHDVADEFGISIDDVRAAAASSWAAPPEFYLDENIAGRTIARGRRDLSHAVHTPASCTAAERQQKASGTRRGLPTSGITRHH